MLALHALFKLTIATFFQAHGHHSNQREHRQAQDQRRQHTETFDNGNRRERWQCKPPVDMVGGDQRAADKEQQRHQHPGITAAHGEQSTRRTTTTQLHADPEDERPEHHRHTGRRHQPHDRLTEQSARAQRREKQQHRHRQHHHLRTQASATPIIDKHAPGRGETEGCVIQRQAQRGADHQQQHLACANHVLQEQRARHQDDKGDQWRDGLAHGRQGKRRAHGVLDWLEGGKYSLRRNLIRWGITERIIV